MIKRYLDTRLDLSAGTARQLRAELSAILPRLNFDQALKGQVQLVVSEWLENLRCHTARSATWVRIRLVVDKGAYTLTIEDNGSHFAAFENALESAVNSIECESGRGLYLLRELFPRHHYCQTAAGENCLTVVISSEPSEQSRILVIDDDPTQRRLLACYLSANYVVDTCSNTDAALNCLDRHKIDLILCDIHMPGESGLNFRQRLLADKGTQDIPFVFISGAEEPCVIASAERLAVDDYLAKPVTKEGVLRVVKRVLNRSRQLYRSLGEKVDQQLCQPLSPHLPPVIDDFSCHLRATVASPGGGDIVLWHRQAGRTLVVFADLMGHGAQAKYYAHALAGYLRGMLYAGDDDLSPGEMLALISEALYDDQLLNSTIATCMVLSLTPGGKIEIASGGHPPPLLWRQQQWQPVAVAGGLPGLIPGAEYNNVILQMSAGERLLVASDGLWEQGDSVQQRHTNEATLLDVIHQQAHEQSDSFIDDVWLSFMRLAAEAPSDDVTLAVFDRGDGGALLANAGKG